MKELSHQADSPHLLDLPIDILTLIFEQILVYHHEDQSDTESDASSTSSQASSGSFNNASGIRGSVPMCPCSGSPIDPLPIFLIHPRIYAVAVAIFYAANEFEIDATRRHAVHVKNLLACSSASPTSEIAGTSRRRRAPTTTSWAGEKKRLPEALQMRAILTKTEALRRIHRLQIKIDRLRGWIHTDLQPVVQDMILKGELVHLQIDVMTPVEGGSLKQARVADGPRGNPSVDETSLFTHQPIAGLLSLLADPYLLTASLRVDSTHRSEWCGWHAAVDGGCAASRKSKPLHRSGMDSSTEAVSMWSLLRDKGVVSEDDRYMIEVDWRGIKGKVDPGGEDLARAVLARRM